MALKTRVSKQDQSRPAGGTSYAHDLGFTELRSETGVFHTWPDRATLRERYHFAACKRCGKIDRAKALRAGFDKDLVRLYRGLKKDAFTTSELQDVLSKRLYDFLAKRFPGTLVGFPVPGTKYLVVLPKKPVEPGDPKRGRSASRLMHKAIGNRCDTCGRPREAVLDSDNVVLPRGVHLMGLSIYRPKWANPFTAWAIDDSVRDALRERNWTGVKVTQGEYGKNAPQQLAAERRRKKQTPENNAWLKLMQDSGLDASGRRLRKRKSKTG